MRLMGDCRDNLDALKRAEEELTEDEEDTQGLTNPAVQDAQSAGQQSLWGGWWGIYAQPTSVFGT